jgi:hypothetical protein
VMTRNEDLVYGTTSLVVGLIDNRVMSVMVYYYAFAVCGS